MTLNDLLDHIDDETWVRLALPDGSHSDIWVADYVGGDSGTMTLLRPLLDLEVDDFAVEMLKPPEDLNLFRRTGLAPFVHVGLLGEREYEEDEE